MQKNGYNHIEKVSPAVHSMVRGFSKSRRNAVRGAVLQYQSEGLSERLMHSIRNNTTSKDMVLAGRLIEGPGGLKDTKVQSLTQQDLWTTYTVEDKVFELEVAYACG